MVPCRPLHSPKLLASEVYETSVLPVEPDNILSEYVDAPQKGQIIFYFVIEQFFFQSLTLACSSFGLKRCCHPPSTMNIRNSNRNTLVKKLLIPIGKSYFPFPGCQLTFCEQCTIWTFPVGICEADKLSGSWPSVPIFQYFQTFKHTWHHVMQWRHGVMSQHDSTCHDSESR